MMTTNRKSSSPVGLFVTLGLSGSDCCEGIVRSRSKYKIEAAVNLPHSNRKEWPNLCAKVFARILDGLELPVRLDYNNAVEYLTLQELAMIEKNGFSLGLFSVPHSAPIKVWDEVSDRTLYQAAYYRRRVRKLRRDPSYAD